MNRYSRPTVFKVQTWCFSIARALLLIAVGSILLIGAKAKLSGSNRFDLPIWVLYPFATWFILAWIGFIIALYLKCDNCGKHPSIYWKEKYNYPIESNMFSRVIDFFYLPEIRENKFRCKHCNTEYSINSIQTGI
jgi:hypothetical protein